MKVYRDYRDCDVEETMEDKNPAVFIFTYL